MQPIETPNPLFHGAFTRQPAFYWLIAVVLSIALLLAMVMIDHQNNQRHRYEAEHKVLGQLSTLRARLEGNFNLNIQAARGLLAVISSNPSLNQAQFSQYAKPLFNNSTQLRNIGAAPDMVIRMTYPLVGNERSIGLNYLTNDKQRAGALLAKDSKDFVLIGPIELVQGGQAFISRIPVYLPKLNGDDEFWGLISAVIDAPKLYKTSGLTNENLNLQLAMRHHPNQVNPKIFFGDHDVFDQQPVLVDIIAGNTRWQLAGMPLNGWSETADNAISFRLMLALFYLILTTPLFILAWVNKQKHNNELRLVSLFEDSPMGIALNDFKTGQFIQANKALLKLSGYSLHEIRQKKYQELTPTNQLNDIDKKALQAIQSKGRYGPIDRDFIHRSGKILNVIINGIITEDDSNKKFIWSYIEDVTEQKIIAESLAEKSNQLELIIDSTNVGIWDWQVQTGQVIFNERWANIIGYSLAELSPITINTWSEHAHPDDLKVSETALNRYWQGETDRYELETRMRHKDGHWVWVLDTGKTVEWLDDGKPKRMVGTHLDITKNKLAEEKIKSANEQQNKQVALNKIILKAQANFIDDDQQKLSFLELMNELSTLTQSQYCMIAEVYYDNEKRPFLKNFEFNNTSWEHSSEQFKSDYQGTGLIIKSIENAFLSVVIDKKSSIQQTISLGMNTHALPKGHPAIHSFMGIPVIRQDTVIAIVGLANRKDGFDEEVEHYLTPLCNVIGQLIESQHIQHEKIQTQKDLVIAKERAEEAAKAKNQFLATMSHEIRTPMNGVLGMLNLLKNSDLNYDQNRKVSIASSSAESLLNIINDILDFSKIDANKMELDNISFRPRKLIGDLAESMAIQAQSKNIELILDLTGLTETSLIGDNNRLRQILSNIVGNAIKFTDHGNITITANCVDENHKKRLTIDIQDEGIGIPENKISSLFTRFSQVDASTTRKYGGTGLGLAISKKLCQLMGGDIYLNSELEKGSRFTFHVLLDEDPNSQPFTIAPRYHNKQVLILCASLKNAQTLGKQLTHLNVNCQVASSNEEALELCKVYSFDLALIDFNLADGTGHELALKIRKIPIQKSIKISMMTNMDQLTNGSFDKSTAIDGYFPKPITSHDIVASFALIDTSTADNTEPLVNKQENIWPEKRKILIVEDIYFNQELALMLLEDMGLHADVASHGQEALDMLLQATIDNAPYNLVLMDCQMPIMDGYQASRAIRNGHAGNKCVPIIAMTANAMAEDQQNCLNAGMNDYLSKPIDADKLKQLIKKWLTQG